MCEHSQSNYSHKNEISNNTMNAMTEETFHLSAINDSSMNLGPYASEPPLHRQDLHLQHQPQQLRQQQQHYQPPPQQPCDSFEASAAPPPPQQPSTFSREAMDYIFQRCRADDWHGVLQQVRQNPQIALTSMTMDNHITTTIIHQAITSKGETAVRAEVISTILRHSPQAASIKNGYGSLPLHVIAQRNTKMDAQTKERLIFELVQSFPAALTEEGGVGKRTPLHIIFTDYISPRLTRMMIEHGGQACFMKDKKGYLPAHVACSRHCSPEKLRMLLAINPHALFDKTNDGNTLMDLAKKQATKSHPNYALIEELNRQLAGTHRVSSEEEDSANRSRLDSNDSAKSWHTYESSLGSSSQQQQQQGPHPHHPYHHHHPSAYAHGPPGMMMQHPHQHLQQPQLHSTNMVMGAQALMGLDDYQHHSQQQQRYYPSPHGATTTMSDAPPSAPRKKKRSSRKRKTSAVSNHTGDNDSMVDDTQPAADLLLHFSRGSTSTSASPRRVKEESPHPAELAEDEPLPVLYHHNQHHSQQQEPTQVTEV